MSAKKEIIFEFMLNALRLTEGVPKELFTQTTGIEIAKIAALLTKAQQKKLLLPHPTHLMQSELGKRFLNDLINIFMW